MAVVGNLRCIFFQIALYEYSITDVVEKGAPLRKKLRSITRVLMAAPVSHAMFIHKANINSMR